MEQVAVARVRSSVPSLGSRRDLGLALAWIAMVLGVIVWGRVADLDGAKLHAAPFFGRYGFHAGPSILIAAGIAAFVALRGDTVVDRLSWRRLLVVAALATGLWSVSLAVGDGWSAFSEPISSPHGYLAVVDESETPSAFLSNFTQEIARYPVHVEGHPPGAPLLFWGLDRVGLSGPGPAALLVLLSWMTVPVAALIAAREMAGERSARRATPFLVLLPAAVWAVTSVDALFAAVAAWGLATFAIATCREGRASDIAATVSGLLWGLGLFLSYGIVPLGAGVVVLALISRRIRPLIVAGVPVAIVVSLFWAAGFWWPDGLNATVERYHAGVASARPLWFFSLANIAVLAVAIGPAASVALGRARLGGLGVLVGIGVLAVMVSNLSGLSKGEVERIWLPFVPWVGLGTAWLVGRARKGWLLAQASVAIAVQMMVVTPW